VYIYDGPLHIYEWSISISIFLMLRQIPTILLPSSCSSSVSIKEILESLKRIASYFADGLKDDRLRFLLILRQSFAFVSNLQVGAHPSSVVLIESMQIQLGPRGQRT